MATILRSGYHRSIERVRDGGPNHWDNGTRESITTEPFEINQR